MFSLVGAVVDRFWAHLLALCGTVTLALFGTLLLEWLTESIDSFWAVLLVIAAASMSVLGTVAAAIRNERSRRATEVEMLTAIRATLVPVALRFISVKRPVDGQAIEDVITDLTLHCRAFVSSDGIDSDANYYRLESTRLTCVNRRAGSARETFTKSRARTPEQVEESAVIDRLLAKQDVLCRDTWSRRERMRLQLVDNRRKYRSFVSVPAVDGKGRVRGMLSVNSSKKNAFSELHVAYLTEMTRMILAIEDTI